MMHGPIRIRLSCRCFLYAGIVKEVKESCRKFSNEGNNVFYISPNFVWAMKLRRVRGTMRVKSRKMCVSSLYLDN